MTISHATQFAFAFGLGLCLLLTARTFQAMADAPPLVAQGITGERIAFYGLALFLAVAAFGAFSYALIVAIDAIKSLISRR